MSDFNKTRMRILLLAGAAGLSIPFVAAPAAAQDNAVPVQAEESDADEIVVTAQKRAESIQDVASSVSVITGGELERTGATQIQDFAGSVPSFVAPSFGTPGRSQLIMRGITTGEGSSTTVGVVLDDAPVNSSTSYLAGGINTFDLMPYDIERVEVLLGPQGTLYGASAMGGLLKYVTVSPNLNEVEVRAGGELSTTRRADDLGWGIRGAANLPIVQGKLAVRVSAYNQETPGFLDNAVTGAEDVNTIRQTGLRGVLLWKPSDTLSIRLSAMTQEVVADARSTVALNRAFPNEPVFGPFDRVNIVPERNRQTSDMFTGIIDWDFGWANLTSVSSYSRNHSYIPLDVTTTLPLGLLAALIPGFPSPAFVNGATDLKLRKFTQEVRLASPSGGALEWMLGGFYTNEKGRNGQPAILMGADLNEDPDFNPLLTVALGSRYKEIALFGNATYRFSDAFDISGGLRWSENRQTFTTDIDGFLADVVGLFPPGSTSDKSSEDVVTFMVSPRFHVSDDVMLYGRIASGYRPGGPNVPVQGLEAQFDADTLINYEIGLKSQFWDRRATINVAAYRIDWEDIQLNVAVGNLGGLANGGRAKSQGFELTTLFEPIDDLRLGFNGSYTDATLKDPVPSLEGFPGDRLPNVPRWQGSASVDYSFPVGGWTGSVGGRLRYIGKRNNGFPADTYAPPGDTDGEFVRLDSYAMVDLNAALESDHWTARLFVKNLFDVLEYPSAGSALGSILYAPVLRPRTIGIAFDVRF